MSKTFIIAEAACTWLHGGLEAAYRSIKAAKDCGADAWKTQWTSDPEAMAMRRGVDRDKYTRLGWSGDVLPKLKAECDRVGIRFLCTVFIEKDLPTIAKYVEFIKVSAFESEDRDFMRVVGVQSKPIIVSVRDGAKRLQPCLDVNYLYVVSEYPTPLEHLRLLKRREHDGLSDHTTSVLTGAVAVGAGARIIEKHVRLSDTPESDPDYGHSLIVSSPLDPRYSEADWGFKTYVDNIREAERML